LEADKKIVPLFLHRSFIGHQLFLAIPAVKEITKWH